jgi:hypothetical protein
MIISTPYLTQAEVCSCDDEACCHPGSLERPRFFPRQVVTAADLNLEHDYQRERARRHNRMLHGWGVVCGAEVCLVGDAKGNPTPWKVAIRPGFALGPCGDEIVIDCERVVDLRTNGLMCMTGMPPGEVSDPWCGDTRVERAGTVCIGIRYREFQARPVRVHPVGCGCGGEDCEYSRWRDGYEVGLLPECPDSRRKVRRRRQLEAEPRQWERAPAYPAVSASDVAAELDLGRRGLDVEMRHGLFECPPCPDDPWVVLACVKVDGGGNVDIDDCGCRRYVASASPFALSCVTPPQEYEDSRQIGEWIEPLAEAEPVSAPEPAPETAPRPKAVTEPEAVVELESDRAPSSAVPKARAVPGPAAAEEVVRPRSRGSTKPTQPKRQPSQRGTAREAKPGPVTRRRPGRQP